PVAWPSRLRARSSSPWPRAGAPRLHETRAWLSALPFSQSSFVPFCWMVPKSFPVFIPELVIVRHPVPYRPELRRDEALAAFSTIPLPDTRDQPPAGEGGD